MSNNKNNEDARRVQAFRKRLIAELKDYQERVERTRQDFPTDSDPDDSAGVAVRNTHREMNMGNLERFQRTIVEIEKALNRIKDGQYTTCSGCQADIPEARLQAIPWTRICVQCAGGGRQFTPPLPGTYPEQHAHG